jgi:nucleoside-diphosphate-sugar epimerase
MQNEAALRILVIGGSGFIGQAVVRALVSSGNCEVISASRTPDDSEHHQACAHHSVDVMDQASVILATVGIDCVVNCYRDNAGESDSARAIANILKACEVNKVKKLIYLSSIAVYGGATGEVHEWTPPSSPIHWYGRAKSQAERACQAQSSSSFRVVVLRPSLV